MLLHVVTYVYIYVYICYIWTIIWILEELRHPQQPGKIREAGGKHTMKAWPGLQHVQESLVFSG